MIEIDFKTNWNGGKLNCENFTTIRRSLRFRLGDKVSIFLKKNENNRTHLCDGYIKRLQVLSLEDLLKKEWLCILDTGYDSQGTKEIITNMYPNIQGKDSMAILLISVTQRYAYAPMPIIEPSNTNTQKDLFDDTDSFLKSLNSDTNMFNNDKF